MTNIWLPIPRAHIGRNCPVSGLTVVWDWTENYINLHFVSDCANVCSNWKFRHESSDLAKALIIQMPYGRE